MFNETQKFRNQFYKFDIDSSPEVFELYDKIYQDSVIKDQYSVSCPKFFRFISHENGYIDAPDPDNNSVNRLYALPVNPPVRGHNKSYKMYDPVDRLSGDCFFNFNMKKVNKLKNIQGIDMEKLLYCVSMHHSIYNMVLLQTVGNIQNRKQKGLKKSDGSYEELDRGDVFIYLLHQFYNNKKDEILGSASQINKPFLKEYLTENFNDVYDYADKMFQISDKDFINKLIENGGKALDSTSINYYLDLAKEFWEIRKAEIDRWIK